MLSQSNNRVQAIKSKFESLNVEKELFNTYKRNNSVPTYLCKQKFVTPSKNHTNECQFEDVSQIKGNTTDERNQEEEKLMGNDSDTSSDDLNATPNTSYLYGKLESNKSICDNRKSTLTRQTSDPCKKLHRSHAFRCDRSQKIANAPRRHGSCSRSENDEVPTLRLDKPRLSKERLRKLGNLLEDRMRKENFNIPLEDQDDDEIPSPSSIPDEVVSSHILDQYAKVLKPKKKNLDSPTDKQDAMTDSGVSSETENLDEFPEKSRLKKLKAQFETAAKTDSLKITKNDNKTNKEILDRFEKHSSVTLDVENKDIKLMDEEFYSSTDTMRLERKNPSLVLTDTLKKALKQPLPAGPPPKKPPRTFTSSPIPPESPILKKKDTKQMLEKLEQALKKHNDSKTITPRVSPKHIYDVAETDLRKKPKEIHYLCTEILDIAHRTLLPNQNSDSSTGCLNSLNCVIPNRSSCSLPYARLSTGSNSARNSLTNICCSCSSDSSDNINVTNPNKLRFSTFFTSKSADNLCGNCSYDCKCVSEKPEHIYDEPFIGSNEGLMDGSGVVKKSIQGDVTLKSGTEVDGSGGAVKTIHNKLENSFNESQYGVVKNLNDFSRSLEDLRLQDEFKDQKIYDIPCDVSRSQSPDSFATSSPKPSFESLRRGFERGFHRETIPKPVDTKPKLKRPQDLPLKPVIASKTSPISPDTKRCIEAGTAKSKSVFIKITDPKFKLPTSISSDNLSEKLKSKKPVESKATEVKRTGRFEKNQGCLGNGLLITKKDKTMLDVDRENLNRLMNEIYETVSAACKMEDEQQPGKFPIDQTDNSSEDSVKLTRSLTEKRKNYVRRVSSRAACLDRNSRNVRFRHQTSVCSYKSENLQENPYMTFRSWKSFKHSQSNLSKEILDRRDSSDSKSNLTDSRGNLLSMKDEFLNESIDNLSLDDKAGCLDLQLPFEPRERGLFHICLLVGLNHMTGKAYVKSVFPSQVTVPPHIENLVFPETLSVDELGSKCEYDLDSNRTQCYSLVLTNERGERNFGYCRRVLPEGAVSCLPLSYCLISRYRAPGFYYKVLQEIESHHGSSDVEIHTILQQLFETDFPHPGEEVTLNYPKKNIELLKNAVYRNSVNLGDILKSKTLPDLKRMDPERQTDLIPDYYDIENNNRKVFLSVVPENTRFKVLKRPIEPRADEDNLTVVLDSLGAGLLLKVFGSLLLERKVVLISDSLSQLSSCMEALQSILYPFVWQQPLISAIPSELRKDILEAPLPILAGMLRRYGIVTDTWEADIEAIQFEEGMLIDLSKSTSKVIFYQGDESTILPTTCYKTLKTTLQMESSKNSQKTEEDVKTRNVFISEAFLRFFIDILGDFWKFFSYGKPKDDLGKEDVIFEKETFVKATTSKHNQYFLEWFTETAMFNHFISNMAACYPSRQKMASEGSLDYSMVNVVDAPLPNFYEMFEERVRITNKKTLKRDEKCEIGKTYKSAVNKKVKLLKNKLRDLVN